MKDMIQGALEHAEALDEELRRVGETLGRYNGDQLTEAKTELQLDRWTRERGLGESMDVAIVHMAKVLAELRWINDELQK